MQGRTLFKGERFMYQLHTKKTYAGLITAAVLVGSLAMTSAQAASAPKVDICHFDADEGIFKPISVNGNAVSKHVENHGDQFPNTDPGNGGITLDEDCFADTTPQLHVFARAFIDVNQNTTYESDTDIDIAIVEDTNDSKLLDVGDTFQAFQYPIVFNPCPGGICNAAVIGNYSSDPLPIDALDTGSPSTTIDFFSNINGNPGEYIRVTLQKLPQVNSLVVSDPRRDINFPPYCQGDNILRAYHVLGFYSRIQQVTGCSPFPDTESHDQSLTAPGYFLEIEFYEIQP
jgi:hypothetical protein